MASENASRLAAMRAAERNIGDRITALRTLYHQSRQMAITEELLDIASGFEALTSTESRAT
jgi:F-type H+-transporting ATPase subunit gamma